MHGGWWYTHSYPNLNVLTELLFPLSALSCFAQTPTSQLLCAGPKPRNLFLPTNSMAFTLIFFLLRLSWFCKCLVLFSTVGGFFHSFPTLNDSQWRHGEGFTWACVLENVVISITRDMESLESSSKQGLCALSCSHLLQLTPRARTFISLTTSWNSLLSKC